MATNIPLLLSLLLLFFSPSFSRKLPSITTTVLDVSTSLQQTTHVLSSNQHNLSQGGNLTDLSLTLHSRDSLTPHQTYKSLTESRLRRDAARVTAISARLSLAVNNVKHSDLTPLSTMSFEDEKLKGPIVSGTSEGSGEYFSRIGIGSPPKQAFLVLDTGSDITWIQCQPCQDCYTQSDPVFDPSTSSSYSQVSCNDQLCKDLDVSACRNNSCMYQVSYGDGSYTLGDFATESLTLGESAPVDNVALGCGHDNEGLFVGAAGLLGLGGGALSFPSQINTKSFSYCLVDRDSTSTSSLEFGGGLADAEVVAPLLKNQKLDTFYYVSMTGISVGGELLSIPESDFSMDTTGEGGVIVDSGTAITRLQSNAYEALRDAFVKGTGDLTKSAGVALFDTCYDLSTEKSVEVPTVVFHFPEGKELKLPAKNYLIPVDSEGTFCFAFAPTSSPLSIIGNVQQQGIKVAFDLGNSMVGFAANKC